MSSGLAAPQPSSSPIRQRILSLTGFMGVGKSTVGRLLAQQMGWHFADLDPLIEAAGGMEIPQIFERLGELAFRELEHQVLERVIGEAVERGRPTVVALGGGTFVQPQNRELLHRSGGAVIWLDCTVEELLARCAGITNRPLFRSATGFRELYEQRKPAYALADFRVEGSAEPRRVVEQILALKLFEPPAFS